MYRAYCDVNEDDFASPRRADRIERIVDLSPGSANGLWGVRLYLQIEPNRDPDGLFSFASIADESHIDAQLTCSQPYRLLGPNGEDLRSVVVDVWMNVRTRFVVKVEEAFQSC
jgi:hypothetical protein